MIIAKIENQEGIENIDSIIDAADAVMVARDNMGVEIPAEKVPFIQKTLHELLRRAIRCGALRKIIFQLVALR